MEEEKPTNPGSPAEFDRFAETYEADLSKGLGISGEGKEYFAAGRMRRLARLFARDGFRPREALDFGCGAGTATPFFFEILGIERLTGTDPSERSLAVARGKWADFAVTFSAPGSEPAGAADLAFCNGVFHHIPPSERMEAVDLVHRSLRFGGRFAFWENNPWNPLTRYAMSRVPFDRDAVLVWPGQARKLLRDAGFRVLRTDYVFFFPAFLRAFRPLEPALCKIPLGGQYLVLAEKA